MKPIKFMIVEVYKMSEQGRRQWKGDKRIFPWTFSGLKIPELKAGIDPRRVDNQKKLLDYVWQKCGSGTYDLRIHITKKGGQNTQMTFARVTLVQTDDLGSKYICTNFDTHGAKNKFGRRYGLFKRKVGWLDYD